MDYHSVYRSGADDYQRLVAAEDVDGNLDRSLRDLLGLVRAGGAGRDEIRLVEIGAGTGRVTRLLAAAGAQVVATEPSAAMIEVAAELAVDDKRSVFGRAEARALPFPDRAFDAAIAGWVFAHQREWSPDDWREVVTGFVAEARRVVRPGGPVVLIETLGTGQTAPNPPAELAEYYRWLESDLGFSRSWIRTDYAFGSVEEAAEITGAFFGPRFAQLVTDEGWDRVPECTGIWMDERDPLDR